MITVEPILLEVEVSEEEYDALVDNGVDVDMTCDTEIHYTRAQIINDILTFF